MSRAKLDLNGQLIGKQFEGGGNCRSNLARKILMDLSVNRLLFASLNY